MSAPAPGVGNLVWCARVGMTTKSQTPGCAGHDGRPTGRSSHPTSPRSSNSLIPSTARRPAINKSAHISAIQTCSAYRRHGDTKSHQCDFAAHRPGASSFTAQPIAPRVDCNGRLSGKDSVLGGDLLVCVVELAGYCSDGVAARVGKAPVVGHEAAGPGDFDAMALG